MPNTVPFWITSFDNSQNQPRDEARDLQGTAPHSLWNQAFADSHAAANPGITATDCPLLSQNLSK
jgi:hypothetical protein